MIKVEKIVRLCEKIEGGKGLNLKVELENEYQAYKVWRGKAI